MAQTPPPARRTRPVSASAAVWERITITTQQRRWPTAYESVPKIIVNNIINLFLKLQSSFWQFQAITVSEGCLIKLFRYILSEKIDLYFSIGNDQPREPALCQLYQHTFVLVLYVADGLVAEWLACWTQAQKGLGSNSSRDAVG